MKHKPDKLCDYFEFRFTNIGRKFQQRFSKKFMKNLVSLAIQVYYDITFYFKLLICLFFHNFGGNCPWVHSFASKFSQLGSLWYSVPRVRLDSNWVWSRCRFRCDWKQKLEKIMSSKDCIYTKMPNDSKPLH